MKWPNEVSFEGFQAKVDNWYASNEGELCDPPIDAQYALDLIFKTLVDDKMDFSYLTSIPESTKQVNSIMLDIILYKYSREYRKFKQQRRRKSND